MLPRPQVQSRGVSPLAGVLISGLHEEVAGGGQEYVGGPVAQAAFRLRSDCAPVMA